LKTLTRLPELDGGTVFPGPNEMMGGPKGAAGARLVGEMRKGIVDLVVRSFSHMCAEKDRR